MLYFCDAGIKDCLYLRHKRLRVALTKRYGCNRKGDTMYYRSAAIAFFRCGGAWIAGFGRSPSGSKSRNILVNCGSGFRVVGNFTEVQLGCKVMASEVTGHGFIRYGDWDQDVRPVKVCTVKEDPGLSDPKELRDVCQVAAIHGGPWLLPDLPQASALLLIA
jgi:hypothetical protein